jgi:hypothetical protein
MQNGQVAESRRVAQQAAFAGFQNASFSCFLIPASKMADGQTSRLWFRCQHRRKK